MLSTKKIPVCPENQPEISKHIRRF